MLTFIIGLGNVLPPAYMDYMDPDVLCPKKADKLNLSLSLAQSLVASQNLIKNEL